MKAKIHPKYDACVVTCGCGNTFETRSTLTELRIDICAACHPFYTGKQKFVDSAGRIEKFRSKYKDFKAGQSRSADEGDGSAPADEAAPAETAPVEAASAE